MKKILILIFIIICFPLNVYAQEELEGKIYIEAMNPGSSNYFTLEANPGEKKTIEVVLRNTSPKYNANATLYTSDAVTGVGGGMAILTPKNIKQEKVGSWFDIKEKQINLNPDQEVIQSFTIVIPQNARPGDHIGNVVIYKLTPTSQKQENTGSNNASVLIDKAYQQSIAVLIKVPGPTKHHLVLEKIEPQWSGKNLYLNLSINNIGNVYEKSSGVIKIIKDNKVIMEKEVNMESIYPETTGIYSLQAVEEIKEKGNYTAKVTWNYVDKKIEKELEFKIADKDVKNSKEVEKATEKAITNGFLVLTKEVVFAIIVGFIVVLGLAVGLTVLILKKRRKK